MQSDVKKLLEAVQAGNVSVDDALHKLKLSAFEDIGYAKVDLHRKIRQGAAEVIYGAGKTPEQIAGEEWTEPDSHHPHVPGSGGFCE